MTTPCPFPKVKMPGAYCVTFMVAPAELEPTLIVTRTAPDFVSHGTCTLIWLDEAKKKGAATPATVNEAPPRVVGSGTLVEIWRLDAIAIPNTLAMLPGATV